MGRIPPRFSLAKCDVWRPLFGPSLQALLAIFVHGTKGAGGNPHHDRIGRNVVDYQRACGNDRVSTDSHVGEDSRPQADDAVVLDHDWTKNLQVGHLIAEYPYCTVVGCERDFSRNGDVIADFDKVGFRT